MLICGFLPVPDLMDTLNPFLFIFGSEPFLRSKTSKSFSIFFISIDISLFISSSCFLKELKILSEENNGDGLSNFTGLITLAPHDGQKSQCSSTFFPHLWQYISTIDIVWMRRY